MKKSVLTLCVIGILSSGFSQGATYYWTGDAGDNQWANQNNWESSDGGAGYYPQGGADIAYIGDQTETLNISWGLDSKGNNYVAKSNSIELGDNVVVSLTLGENQTAPNIKSLTLGHGAQFLAHDGASIGFDNDVTYNFGNFGYGSDNHGYVEFDGASNVWGNNHIYSLVGTLDSSLLFDVTEGETVMIDLVKFDVGGAAGNEHSVFKFDTSKLDLGGIQGASIVEVNGEGGIYSVSIQYTAPIPEPATATLSLLGLGALMMRRRRA